MGEVVVFGTLQDERGLRGMTKLVLIAWASAYCDEEFGVLDPVGSVVLKPYTHNRYNCSIGKKVRGMMEVYVERIMVRTSILLVLG